MRESILDILVDPTNKEPMGVRVDKRSIDGDIIEGVRGTEGASYPISEGIPRILLNIDKDQLQTSESFADKWMQRHIYDSPSVKASTANWLVERYGFKSLDDMQAFFASKERILDAGCGGAHSAAAWMDSEWRRNGNIEWVGLDISGGIDVAK